MNNGKIFEELPIANNLSGNDLILAHQSTGVKTITKDALFKPVNESINKIDSSIQDVQSDISEIQTKIVPKYINVAISAGDWSESTLSCSKAVQDIDDSMRPLVSLFMPADLTAEEYSKYTLAYSHIVYCNTAKGQVTFRCLDEIPDRDLQIVLEI